MLEGPAFVALMGDLPIGIVSWHAGTARADAAHADAARAQAPQVEVRVLLVAAEARGRGVGRALIDATAAALRGLGVRRAWLVTTNDNLAALALYQKAGWRLAALRPAAVDEARRTIKPSIPELGDHGIPLRDELELELDLERPT